MTNGTSTSSGSPPKSPSMLLAGLSSDKPPGSLSPPTVEVRTSQASTSDTVDLEGLVKDSSEINKVSDSCSDSSNQQLSVEVKDGILQEIAMQSPLFGSEADDMLASPSNLEPPPSIATSASTRLRKATMALNQQQQQSRASRLLVNSPSSSQNGHTVLKPESSPQQAPDMVSADDNVMIMLMNDLVNSQPPSSRGSSGRKQRFKQDPILASNLCSNNTGPDYLDSADHGLDMALVSDFSEDAYSPPRPRSSVSVGGVMRRAQHPSPGTPRGNHQVRINQKNSIFHTSEDLIESRSLEVGFVVK
ncbi:hypothetical protein Ciccas_004918 [Cichlidogyrus casuarinus]|uniref:Uncharacterized protein n=1 Tax=Cichlidogyrus casuarinus TaxID=1844966 RepID=A0ABD2QA65_9PLAT